MRDTVPTTHAVRVTVDPAMAPAVIATPEGLTVRTDADPAKIGRALLSWIGTARRIELGERGTSGDAIVSLLDTDTDRSDDR